MDNSRGVVVCVFAGAERVQHHGHAQVAFPVAFGYTVLYGCFKIIAFNMFDPARPITWGYYDTYAGPHESRGENNVNTGAWGVDIRNSDGLIVVTDMVTGFWVFRMEGFEGWNGNDWGMPNLSSAQDWENGPAEQAMRMTGPEVVTPGR